MKRKVFMMTFMATLMMPFTVFAANLTKDDLSAALTKFGSACQDYKDQLANSAWTCTDNKNVYTVDDTKITIKAEDGSIQEVNYVINEDGTINFTQEIVYTKGLTYDQYKAKRKEGSALPSVAMVAVAMARGAAAHDIAAYHLLTLFYELAEKSKNGTTSSPSYIISADDVTASNDDGLVIKESEFPEKILEVLPLDFPNWTYTDTYKDKSGQDYSINSYKYTQNYTKIDDNSGKVTLTTVVDSNADYTKLNGFYDAHLKDLDISLDSSNKSQDPTLEEETQPTEKNPNTSVLISKYSLIALAAILIGVVLIRKKAYFHKI